MRFLGRRRSGLVQVNLFQRLIMEAALAGLFWMGAPPKRGLPPKPAKRGLDNPVPRLAQVGAIPAGRESLSSIAPWAKEDP